MERTVRWRSTSTGAVLFALAALFLAVAVRAGWTVRFDHALLLGLAAPSGLVGPISAVTWLGDSLTRAIVTAVVGIMLVAGGAWRRGLGLVLVVAGGAALNSGLKGIVMRQRPELLQHLDHVTTSSFPSGHSANSTILYLCLAALVPTRYRRGAVAAAALLAGLIGLSRIALAVHWPSDVLAGWCVGTAWLLLWWNQLARRTHG